MAFGMFLSNPFEAFERGYGYDSFNPWTTYNRRPFIRPQSTRRFVNPAFMWDIPTEIAMNDDEEYLDRRKQYTPHRKGKCRKCKPKSRPAKSQLTSHQPIFDETPESNDEQSSKNTDSDSNIHFSKSPEHEMSHLRVHDSDEDEKLRQNTCDKEVSKNEEDSETDYEPSQEPEKSESVQQSQEDYVVSNNEKETCSKSENQPEVKIPEVSCQLPVKGDDNENNEEECNEKENVEEETDKKLELIQEQLKKAKELVSNDVLSDQKLSEKRRLYLTEMLLQCILDLDIIEAQGNGTVKLRRREAVREIQTYLDQVEQSSLS